MMTVAQAQGTALRVGTGPDRAWAEALKHWLWGVVGVSMSSVREGNARRRPLRLLGHAPLRARESGARGRATAPWPTRPAEEANGVSQPHRSELKHARGCPQRHGTTDDSVCMQETLAIPEPGTRGEV